MGYIRVRDFAAENNCTAQNIYKHLRNYAKELEGHVIAGPGKQGQLLDDEAQAFLRNIMYPKAITVDSDTMAAELAEMRVSMMKMGQENLRLAAELATTQGERDRALLDAGQYQKLLKASQEAEEAKDERIQQLSQENHDLQVRAGAAELREQQVIKDKEWLAGENTRLRNELHGLNEDLAWAQTPWWKKLFIRIRQLLQKLSGKENDNG